jgi:hypothetical protein
MADRAETWVDLFWNNGKAATRRCILSTLEPVTRVLPVWQRLRFGLMVMSTRTLQVALACFSVGASCWCCKQSAATHGHELAECPQLSTKDSRSDSSEEEMAYGEIGVSNQLRLNFRNDRRPQTIVY